MASRLNPYLQFDGIAREAMEFYRDVFGGELTVSTYGEFGESDAALAPRIMHSTLETPAGYTLMGADAPPGTDLPAGSSITVALSGDAADAADLRTRFERLSAGGTVTCALDKQMWGDEYGSVTDRFGVSWLVNIAQS